MKKESTLKIISLAALIGASDAAVIAQWDFNAPSDKETASTGMGTATLLSTTATFASDTASGGSTDPNAVGTGNGGGAWNTTSYPTQSTGSGTAGAQFSANTVGFASPTYGGLEISFDLRTSNTASRWYRLDYSTNGGSDWTFGIATSFGTDPNLGDTWHNGNTVSINDLAALNNADFAFRVVSVFSPLAFTEANSSTDYDANTAYEVARNTSSNYGGGTMRFDMVTVTAVVPEPSSALLGGLALLTLLRRRR